jgi:CxxC motif-containing protein (DUF1111 family)
MRQMRLEVLRCALLLTVAGLFGLASQPVVGDDFGGGGIGSGLVGVAANNTKKPPSEVQIEDGKSLFLKRWKEMDEMAGSGDGLGPVYNARSCAECHGMVRPGGAGGNDHNVDMLTLTAPTLGTYQRGKFIKRMEALDAALTAGFKSVRPSVTLHKFGTNPDYEDWRFGVVKTVRNKNSDLSSGRSLYDVMAEANKKKPSPLKGVFLSDLQHLRIVQRSTPALFGAGLIDKISDQALADLAKTQAQGRDGVKGQVAIATAAKAGKFGWRGQTATLSEFVMGACANELGLEVPGHPQGVDPLDPQYHVKGTDLNQAECDNLTAFVASLPRPTQRRPTSLTERKTWDGGEQVFSSVGCANCHVRQVANVDGLYSDLLLHDMGPELADPAGANPSSSSGGVSPAYYGGPTDLFATVPPITKRQWRTPPLWGVADSAPYLHDGRAATLTEAIRLHAGEAMASVRLFVMLPSVERQKLLAFLGSLSAPSDEKLLAKE